MRPLQALPDASAGEIKVHDRPSILPKPDGSKPKIAILIVAYNAVSTLSQVLDRIPKEVWEKVEEVMVFDDGSRDDTYLVGLGYKHMRSTTKLSLFRNEQNLGYGGNQARGYRYALDKGYDIVALLHGDGQYAPECLPALLAPVEQGEADAVFGSRMMESRGALAGGMPLYKYVGNRVLTAVENGVLGTSLSEFHSGYRIYSCHALRRLPFERNTHDFHFDTQIIVQLLAAGLRIKEIPIPTYYGDEICHVNGMQYAGNVVRSVLEYKLHELGVRAAPEYEVRPRYSIKKSPLSSHSRLVDLVGPGRRKVLDIGCGTGELGAVLRARGHHVTGVDMIAPEKELDAFYEADIARGLPQELRGPFDLAILGDVLEHVPEPEALLAQARARLAPKARVLVSLPNVVHWSVRAQVLLGRFDYGNQGILDRGHLRFYTHKTARRMFERAGFSVAEWSTTPVPWEKVIGGRFLKGIAERADHALGRLSPNLFAYQHIFVLTVDA